MSTSDQEHSSGEGEVESVLGNNSEADTYLIQSYLSHSGVVLGADIGRGASSSLDAQEMLDIV